MLLHYCMRRETLPVCTLADIKNILESTSDSHK